MNLSFYDLQWLIGDQNNVSEFEQSTVNNSKTVLTMKRDKEINSEMKLLD